MQGMVFHQYYAFAVWWKAPAWSLTEVGAVRSHHFFQNKLPAHAYNNCTTHQQCFFFIFHCFHQIWFKAKCSQCARPQKEFRSFQYIWPPPCSPQAYKRREWPLLKTHHSRDKRLWRTRRFDLRLLPVHCSPHHFPGLFTGSKPSPSVWRLSSTRLWVLLWFPPTPSLKATEYFLSVGWHHLQEKWICFLLRVSLALSPNPLFSVYLFLRQQGGWPVTGLDLLPITMLTH